MFENQGDAPVPDLSGPALRLLRSLLKENGMEDCLDSPSLQELVGKGCVRMTDSYRTFPAGTSTMYVIEMLPLGNAVLCANREGYKFVQKIITR